MRTALFVLVLAGLAAAQDAKGAIDLHLLAYYFQGFSGPPKGPKARGKWEKDRLAFYREKYAGKTASGRVAVVAKRVDRKSGRVTLVGEAQGKEAVVCFDLVLKDKDDPLLKKLKVGGKHPDKVIVTGVMDRAGVARLEGCVIRNAD